MKFETWFMAENALGAFEKKDLTTLMKIAWEASSVETIKELETNQRGLRHIRGRKPDEKKDN